jgi:hypothetical protein
MTTTPITLLQIMKSVRAKTGAMPQSPQQLIELIHENHLGECIAGTHDGKPVTHARAIEITTGEKLK